MYLHVACETESALGRRATLAGVGNVCAGATQNVFLLLFGCFLQLAVGSSPFRSFATVCANIPVIVVA